MRIGQVYRVTKDQVTFFVTISNGWQIRQGSPAAMVAWQFGYIPGSYTVSLHK